MPLEIASCLIVSLLRENSASLRMLIVCIGGLSSLSMSRRPWCGGCSAGTRQTTSNVDWPKLKRQMQAIAGGVPAGSFRLLRADAF